MTIQEDDGSTHSGGDARCPPDDDVKRNSETEMVTFKNGKTKVNSNVSFKSVKGVESEEDESRDNDTEDKARKPEAEALLAIETSAEDGWVPDGGWGWAVVVGGVIVHVFIGKYHDYTVRV